jgi:hypothetical protein
VRSEATSRARAEGIALCHQHVNITLLGETLPRERGSFSSKPESLSVMIVLQRFECKPNVRHGAPARSTNSGASRQGTARLVRTAVSSLCSSASTDVTAAT